MPCIDTHPLRSPVRSQYQEKIGPNRIRHLASLSLSLFFFFAIKHSVTFIQDTFETVCEMVQMLLMPFPSAPAPAQVVRGRHTPGLSLGKLPHETNVTTIFSSRFLTLLRIFTPFFLDLGCSLRSQFVDHSRARNGRANLPQSDRICSFTERIASTIFLVAFHCVCSTSVTPSDFLVLESFLLGYPEPPHCPPGSPRLSLGLCHESTC